MHEKNQCLSTWRVLPHPWIRRLRVVKMSTLLLSQINYRLNAIQQALAITPDDLS